MDLYYGKADDDGKIVLVDDEFRHLKVVRTNVGDQLSVTDGEGNLFTASIIDIGKHDCKLAVINKEQFEKQLPLLHLAIAPTKNIDRIEWLVEKCVEAGIDRISFLKCRHSERKEIKTERLNRIAISAMKQSKKKFLPVISEITDFNLFVQSATENQKLICEMNAPIDHHIKNILKREDALILIGPEGDFSQEEIGYAGKNGFLSVNLGPERLRTETAALSACVYFNFFKH